MYYSIFDLLAVRFDIARFYIMGEDTLPSWKLSIVYLCYIQLLSRPDAEPFLRDFHKISIQAREQSTQYSRKVLPRVLLTRVI